MKSILTVAAFAFAALFLSACSEYNAGYYQAPQPQEKSMQQVAQESVGHLSAQETANLNKLTK